MLTSIDFYKDLGIETHSSARNDLFKAMITGALAGYISRNTCWAEAQCAKDIVAELVENLEEKYGIKFSTVNAYFNLYGFTLNKYVGDIIQLRHSFGVFTDFEGNFKSDESLTSIIDVDFEIEFARKMRKQHAGFGRGTLFYDSCYTFLKAFSLSEDYSKDMAFFSESFAATEKIANIFKNWLSSYNSRVTKQLRDLQRHLPEVYALLSK